MINSFGDRVPIINGALLASKKEKKRKEKKKKERKKERKEKEKWRYNTCLLKRSWIRL